MPDAPRADDDEPAPLIWRWLPLRLALAALPLAPTFTVLAFNVGPFIRSIAALTLGVTLVSPVYGLLLTAAIAPFGELIAASLGATNFRISEVVVLAFLTGWLLRWLPDRRGPRVAAPAAGWLFAIAVAASIAGLAWQLGRYPGELPGTIDQVVHGYFYSFERIGLVNGARLLEGMALAAATVILFRRHPSLANTLPLALAAPAALAALSSMLLWRGIGTAEALQRYKQIGYRVSAHVGDVNAAGSYFAMIVCVALGMAMRHRGRRRALWLCLAAASGGGLWLSESRSALGAVIAVVTVAVLWASTSRFSTRARATALAIVMLALLGGAAFRARLLESDPGYRGVGFRQQFMLTSLRMIGARPLFGIGEGQYYSASPLFLSPQLAWTYGSENAHNYFLQVGGELGLVGLTLFGIWLLSPIVRIARALARTPRDARLLGVGGGVTVFLITCLAGHPFLIGEVAYPFWMLFGLMTALAGSALLNGAANPGAALAHDATPRARGILTVAAAIAIAIASPVLTSRAEIGPPQSQAVDGFYAWETLEDGTRFRWTGQYASLFVPADVTRVEIPVRLPTDGRSIRPMGVEVMTAATDRGRTIVDATWAILSLPLPPATPPARFKRIDLRVDRVWQPALYIGGSADLRSVGVQVGEPRLFREP
jgi:O-antigen ligase